MSSLRGARFPLLNQEVATRLSNGRAQVDVAAPGFHTGQHDVLRKDRQQGLGIGSLELHSHNRQVNAAKH